MQNLNLSVKPDAMPTDKNGIRLSVTSSESSEITLRVIVVSLNPVSPTEVSPTGVSPTGVSPTGVSPKVLLRLMWQWRSLLLPLKTLNPKVNMI